MTTEDARVAYELARAAQRRRRRRARPLKETRQTSTGMRLQPPAASPTQRRGSAAEARALALLEEAGLTLVARNLRCKVGEIDLLMRDGDVLVFIEVRARGRRGAAYGGAAASVEHSKQRRLTLTAAYFLQTMWRGELPFCRFDVVLFEDDEPVWVRAAFDVDDDNR